MVDTSDLDGREVVNLRGERIGKINALLSHGDADQPSWARVKIGRLGLHSSVVPLDDAVEEDGHIKLLYETEYVEEAPSVDPDGDRLSDEDADLLCRHYGLERVAAPSGIEDDDIELPRETRDAKPPALEEGPDSPLNKRRRERAKELGVPDHDETGAPDPGETTSAQ